MKLKVSRCSWINITSTSCFLDCLRGFGLIPKIDARRWMMLEVHDRGANNSERRITSPDSPLLVKVIPRHSRIRGRCWQKLGWHYNGRAVWIHVPAGISAGGQRQGRRLFQPQGSVFVLLTERLFFNQNSSPFELLYTSRCIKTKKMQLNKSIGTFDNP